MRFLDPITVCVCVCLTSGRGVVPGLVFRRVKEVYTLGKVDPVSYSSVYVLFVVMGLTS